MKTNQGIPLTDQQQRVLDHLAAHPEQRPSAASLSRALGVDTRSCDGSLRGLLTRGLVRRAAATRHDDIGTGRPASVGYQLTTEDTSA